MRARVVLSLCLTLFLATPALPAPPAPAPPPPSRDDAVGLLRRALAFRPPNLERDSRPCIYLALEASDFAPDTGPPFQPPLDRIDPAWLAVGTPVTRERYGCAETLAYSWPIFDTATIEGRRYDLASVQIARLCGPICGEAGSLGFARAAGERDWEQTDYSEGVMY